MKLNTRNIMAIAGTAIVLGMGFTACKKDKNNGTTPTPTPSAYPKTVNIEYTLTKVAGIDTVSTIAYTNESGGTSSASNIKLPFSKKITRTVNRYDNLGYGFNATGTGSVRMMIIVDGTTVKDQTFSGTTVLSGTLPYIFQ